MDTIKLKKTVSFVRYDLEETIIILRLCVLREVGAQTGEIIGYEAYITSRHNQVAALRSIKFTIAMGIKLSMCEAVE